MSDQELYERVAEIVDSAQAKVVRTVNTEMIQAYWRIGRAIVEVEQRGEGRAAYGEGLIKRLARRLTDRYGRGWSVAGLKRMRQFFYVFPEGSRIGSILLSRSEASSIGSTALSQSEPRFPAVLSWSHYLVLMRIANDAARAFYEIEAAREGWSVRELERQVGAFVFERLSRHKGGAQIEALERSGQEVATARDVIKDPFVLEFLDLKERPGLHERDLEQSIIDRLEAFLLELGKGFCFVGRQKRITVEGDHFYVDLVFYNRLLRAFVLVDLKLGKLTHQDLGQMQMYVNYFDRHQRAEHEARTIGIVLCSDKNDAMVKITLPEDNEQILAARYLPTEDELRIELAREREEAERALRMSAEGD